MNGQEGSFRTRSRAPFFRPKSPTTRPAGVLEHIDPNTIIIEANVRPSEPVTKEFVASIREYGVLTPVYGRRDEHGNILVRAGQRRTLGAREAGIATMPVYVIDGDESTTRRIIEQLIENEHRKDLSDADRAAAWQQLSFEGMSPAAIAKKTGTKTDRVKQGLAIVESSSASSAIVEHQLDLEQAATLIEFEDDPEVTAELIAIAKEQPSQFQHAAQRARAERARAERVIAAKIEAVAASSRKPDTRSSPSALRTTTPNASASNGCARQRAAASTRKPLPPSTVEPQRSGSGEPTRNPPSATTCADGRTPGTPTATRAAAAPATPGR